MMGRRSAHALAMAVSIGACSPTQHVEEPPPVVEWPPAATLDLQVELEPSDPGRDPAAHDGLDVERVHAEDVVVEKSEALGLRFLDVQLGRVREGEAVPLIVVLHGRGDRPRVPGGPFEKLPLPVRVVIPRAPDPLGTGYSWLPVRVGENKPEVLGFALANMAVRLAEFIEHVRATRPTLGPTILTGFSQGALLTYTLALRHPHVVGRAFPHAGWLPPFLVPPEKAAGVTYPPIRSMHGNADSRVPFEPTRQMMGLLAEAGFDVELHEFPDVEHVMSEEMDALFHEWLVQAVYDAAGITPPTSGALVEADAEVEEVPIEDAATDLTEDVAGDPVEVPNVVRDVRVHPDVEESRQGARAVEARVHPG